MPTIQKQSSPGLWERILGKAQAQQKLVGREGVTQKVNSFLHLDPAKQKIFKLVSNYFQKILLEKGFPCEISCEQGDIEITRSKSKLAFLTDTTDKTNSRFQTIVTKLVNRLNNLFNHIDRKPKLGLWFIDRDSKVPANAVVKLNPYKTARLSDYMSQVRELLERDYLAVKVGLSFENDLSKLTAYCLLNEFSQELGRKLKEPLPREPVYDKEKQTMSFFFNTKAQEQEFLNLIERSNAKSKYGHFQGQLDSIPGFGEVSAYNLSVSLDRMSPSLIQEVATGGLQNSPYLAS